MRKPSRRRADSRSRAVAVVVGNLGDVRVGITGVGPKAYRANAVESALRGQAVPTAEAIARAAPGTPLTALDALGDIHATPGVRVHLAEINTATRADPRLQRAR